MIIIYILAGLLYFNVNFIITLSWLVDYHKKHKGALAVILILFGLPIMLIVLIIAIIGGILEVLKNEQ